MKYLIDIHHTSYDNGKLGKILWKMMGLYCYEINVAGTRTWFDIYCVSSINSLIRMFWNIYFNLNYNRFFFETISLPKENIKYLRLPSFAIYKVV